MTNFEKIKNMSVDEIAEFLPCPYMEWENADECVYGWHDHDCNDCTKQWLESEVRK